MIDNLINKLRAVDHLSLEDCFCQSSLYDKAANRIEQLTGEVQRWQGMFDEKHNLMLEHKARAEAAAQADYEARIRAALAPTDYTLAPHLQKIVDGAKTAPQWDMQADRLAPTDAPDTDLLFDAYKGMLVLHRTLDRMGLARGSATASRIADKIVAAHPEFPARTALRHTEEPK